MNVIQRVDHARDIIEILYLGFPVRTGDRIDDIDGGPGGAEIDLLVPGFHVMVGVLAMPPEMPSGPGAGVPDQRSPEGPAAIALAFRAGFGHRLYAAGNGIGETRLS